VFRRWLSWPLIIVAILASAGLLLAWVEALLPLGSKFTLSLLEAQSGQIDTVYDVLERRQYVLAYGPPPLLQAHIRPAGAVQITLEGQETVLNPPVSGDG